jgi:dynein heavy chain, axonemal
MAALEDAMKQFEEAKACVMHKDYNYLEHRQRQFDDDYDLFLAEVERLKTAIGQQLESNYDTVWESPQAIKFLVKFEKVLPKTQFERF